MTERSSKLTGDVVSASDSHQIRYDTVCSKEGLREEFVIQRFMLNVGNVNSSAEVRRCERVEVCQGRRDGRRR